MALGRGLDTHAHTRTLLLLQVVVVEGETGSGKTTQIPQFLVDAGYTKARRGEERGMDWSNPPVETALTSTHTR